MTHSAFHQAIDIIAAETAALESLAKHLDPQVFNAVIADIQGITGRVIVTGVGKSGLIAAKIAATFSSTGTPASFMHMADAGHGDLGMVQPHDLVIVLSNSGQSRELIPVLTYCERLSIPLVAITAKATSALATSAKHCLLIPQLPEACPLGLAPMSSTTMQLALGDAIAGALITARGFSRQDFGKRHMSGSLGLRTMTIGEFMRAQENEHGDSQTPLVLPNAPLVQVVDAITAGRIGATLVGESCDVDPNSDTNTNGDGKHKQPETIGIVTDGDIRRALSQERFDLTAADIMTANPICLPSTALLADVLAPMRDREISVLVVKDLNKNQYRMLHMHDLLKLGL